MKKFLILILMLAPMSLLAQKFGYVNSAEIIQVMPEYSKALKDIQALEKTYTDDFNSMRTELERKGTEFEKMQQRLQEYGQTIQQNLSKAESEKMMEIQTVLKRALDAVGKDGAYVCIFDIAGGIPFINTTICEDVTPKVRAKLGIPANAVPAVANR